MRLVIRLAKVGNEIGNTVRLAKVGTEIGNKIRKGWH